MVTVPAGWFWMGSTEGEAANRPPREVYLDAYEIDRTEVTRAQFTEFLQAIGSEDITEVGIGFNDPDLPVNGVLWEQAEAYCRFHGKRLPTEAEWEKAARGTDGREYPWGNTWNPWLANTIESGKSGPITVGSIPRNASPYGALDMAGNVAEWVADFIDPEYYSYGPDVNPTGTDKILNRGLRGGSWDSPPDEVTTYFRNSTHSARPDLRVGFRCVRSIENN